MSTWRCPHCGTPQAETSRCWVCKRSSTSCGTCRHFRRAIAGQLGYCGLDRRRQPLRGDEMRGCWEGALETPAVGTEIRTDVSVPSPRERPRLDFVPLETAQPEAPVTAAVLPAPARPAPDPLLGFWAEEG